LCLRTCCKPGCKPVHSPENPPELGQPHHPRSSPRTMKQRRSNSTSTCTLPTIPEYPGFQDFKLSRNYLVTSAFNQRFQDLGRKKRSSSSSS
ncbi:hypothetical protein N300_07439, partial [Calypte anna]